MGQNESCGKCNSCGSLDRCSCEKLVVPGPMYGFPIDSYIWIGEALSCGNTIVVQPGQNLGVAFANLLSYACNLQLIPGPAGPPGADGPAGPTEVIHTNTLYVSTTGSDTMGTRHDITKPFLTIAVASQNAVPGDTIIILPGTYNEGFDNWLVSDVNYYFMPGAVVQTNSNCIRDNGSPTNIRIFGYGDFYANSGSGIFLTNPATTIHFEFNTLTAFRDGITIATCDTMYIKGNRITHYFQYLATLRGNCQGVIDIGVWDGRGSTLGSTSIYVRSHSLDLIPRKIILKGQYLYSNSYSNNAGAIGIGLSGSVIVDYQIENTHHEDPVTSNEYPIFQISSGNLIINKVYAVSITGKGFALTSDGSFSNTTIEVVDSKIVSLRESFIQTAGDHIRIARSVLLTENPVGTAGAVNGGTSFEMIDSSLQNNGASDGITFTNGAVKHILSNVIVIADSGYKSLMTGGGSINVSILNNFISNAAVDAGITNAVTGTNMIVDANVVLSNPIILG